MGTQGNRDGAVTMPGRSWECSRRRPSALVDPRTSPLDARSCKLDRRTHTKLAASAEKAGAHIHPSS